MLRMINGQLLSDLDLVSVENIISQRVNSYNQRLLTYANVEAVTLLDSDNDIRRLQSRCTWDFIHWIMYPNNVTSIANF